MEIVGRVDSERSCTQAHEAPVQQPPLTEEYGALFPGHSVVLSHVLVQLNLA